VRALDCHGDGVRRITAPPGLMTPTGERMVGVPSQLPERRVSPLAHVRESLMRGKRRRVVTLQDVGRQGAG